MSRDFCAICDCELIGDEDELCADCESESNRYEDLERQMSDSGVAFNGGNYR